MVDELKPKGIHNLGNTCFLNTCMQILLQTYELDLPNNNNNTNSGENILETQIYNEWRLWKQNLNNSNIDVISPNSFIINIHQIAEKKNRVLFTGFAQNDMPEFLLFFIENMHIYFKREIEYNIRGNIKHKIDKLAVQCYNMLKNRYEKDYSPLIDIFYGISISTIYSLDKQFLSSVSEPYFILDLPISGKTIYDCLDQYISPELMENENAWFNEKTQQKENVYKEITFWNFPKIIVFTFKRFSTETSNRGIHLSKKTDLIDFPLQDLDLSKYIRGYNAYKYKYDLYGICNHIGNIMGGHYTAFVKNTENQWFHCNDTIIEKIEYPLQMVTPMAYSLFYRIQNS